MDFPLRICHVAAGAAGLLTPAELRPFILKKRVSGYLARDQVTGDILSGDR